MVAIIGINWGKWKNFAISPATIVWSAYVAILLYMYYMSSSLCFVTACCFPFDALFLPAAACTIISCTIISLLAACGVPFPSHLILSTLHYFLFSACCLLLFSPEFPGGSQHRSRKGEGAAEAEAYWYPHATYWGSPHVCGWAWLPMETSQSLHAMAEGYGWELRGELHISGVNAVQDSPQFR